MQTVLDRSCLSIADSLKWEWSQISAVHCYLTLSSMSSAKAVSPCTPVVAWKLLIAVGWQYSCASCLNELESKCACGGHASVLSDYKRAMRLGILAAAPGLAWWFKKRTFSACGCASGWHYYPGTHICESSIFKFFFPFFLTDTSQFCIAISSFKLVIVCSELCYLECCGCSFMLLFVSTMHIPPPVITRKVLQQKSSSHVRLSPCTRHSIQSSSLKHDPNIVFYPRESGCDIASHCT